MKSNPEENPYVLDCFIKPFPDDPENFNPEAFDGQEGFDTDVEARARAEVLLKAGKFKAIVLYQDAGDEWKELDRYPE